MPTSASVSATSNAALRGRCHSAGRTFTASRYRGHFAAASAPGMKRIRRESYARRMPARPATGLIIGRFNPPHLGHSHMIEWAARRVDHLVVFVNTRAGELVPGELRAQWL